MQCSKAALGLAIRLIKNSSLLPSSCKICRTRSTSAFGIQRAACLQATVQISYSMHRAKRAVVRRTATVTPESETSVPTIKQQGIRKSEMQSKAIVESAEGLPGTHKLRRRCKATNARDIFGDPETVKQEPVTLTRKKRRHYANAYTRKGEGFSALVDKLAFEEESNKREATFSNTLTAGQHIEIAHQALSDHESGRPHLVKRKKSKAPPSAVAALEDGEATTQIKLEEKSAGKEAAVEKPKRRRKKPTTALEEQPAEANADGGGATLDASDLVAAPKRQRRRKQADPNAPPPFAEADAEVPSVEQLEAALQGQLPPRPVPNLGFACLNATLRAQKPAIFSNRDCIKRTWEAKGVDWISQLALENCKALHTLIFWNHLHGIRFFRMSSKIFPWCTEWELQQLPQQQEIAETLAAAGRLARGFDQRLTFHPSHFVKLGCAEGPLLDRSIKELEVHSQMLDLMGYEPSPENKINIHIGGMYGDKESTIQRFAKNFERLSSGCKKRLTVENDDWANSYSISDLLKLHELIKVPLVFDFHHHRFCPGGLTEEEALRAAIATWPKGIRPVVHWSESQEGRRPSAHSDFVTGPLRLYGLEEHVDVMIEAKGKELALLRLRDPSFQPHAAALATLGDD